MEKTTRMMTMPLMSCLNGLKNAKKKLIVRKWSCLESLLLVGGGGGHSNNTNSNNHSLEEMFLEVFFDTRLRN